MKNEKTDEIIYTPIQSFEKIQQLIHNYTGYFNEIEYSLIRMAILHYQFGCIHPFYDGNGRKGIEKTSKDTITKINDIKRLMNKIIEEVK